MSAYSLTDLVTMIAQSDVVATVKATAATLGLLPSDWLSGDPEDTLAQALTQTFTDFWNTYCYTAIRGGWLDTAKGKWLDWTGNNVFNTARNPATAAAGNWTGTATGPVGPYSIGDVVFECLDTGVTYTNSAPFSMVNGDTLDIALVADIIGSGGNAAPTRVVLQHTVVGLAGSNSGPIAGADVELDAPYAARCRLSYFALSPNGPGDAFRYVATSAKVNGGVSGVRTKVSPWSTTGVVTQILAGPAGALPGGDFSTVSAAVQKQVVVDVGTYTPVNATNHAIGIKFTAYTRSADGIDPTKALARVTTALGLFFPTLPIEGDIIPPATLGIVSREGLASKIQDAINDLDGDGTPDTNSCFKVNLISPAADVVINAQEVPVLGTIDPASSVVAV